MFPQLPEELEYMIWKFYFSSDVLFEIKTKESIWEMPSEDLFKNTRDYGAIQKDHTDLERLFEESPPHGFPLDFVVEGKYNDRSCEECIYGRYNRCYDMRRDNYLCYKADAHWDLSFYVIDDYLI